MKILWVKSGSLYPLDTGGKKRTHNMLRELSRVHEVTYLALKAEDVPLDAEEEAAPYAGEKIWIPWSEAARISGRFFFEIIANLFSSLPYTLAKYRSRRLESEILRLCAERNFDLIVCDFLFPAVNFPAIASALKVPTILFQHNMEAQIWKRMAAGKSNPLARLYFTGQFKRMHRWEEKLSRLFDGVITVSPEDSAFARDVYRLDNVIGDVPTGVDAEYFQPDRRNDGSGAVIGFLGSMDWMPNIEAVHWFVREVYGKVRAKAPAARLLVIGRRPPSSVTALAASDDSIEVTGTVEDVRPYLARCDLLVVPLLSGGGTRIKIMEALAAGLAIVSTTVGAEGLGLVDGEHILIADEPGAFAEKVVALLDDPEQRARIAASGTALVREHHGWARATAIFLEHCEPLLRK